MKKSLILILALALNLAIQAQTPGTPVETFGDGGYAIFAVNPTFDELHDVVVREDGYIYSIGATQMSDYTAFVSRHDPNGIIDESFADNGFFTYDIPNYCGYARGGHCYEDGSVVFGIHAFDIVYYSDCDAHLVKLTPDGSLDYSFGTNGHVKFNDGSMKTTLEDIQVLPDGRIVMIGYQNDRLIVICYNANGTLDTTFGTNGYIKPEFTTTLNGVYAKGSCVQDDGKIVVCGMADAENNTYTGFVVRINPNGTLDSTFGTSEPGLSKIDAGNDGHTDFCMEPAMQSTGKIVVCGHTWKGQNPALEYAVFVTRLNENGSIDETFGSNGFVDAEFDQGHENDAEAIVVSATDDISVAGWTYNGIGTKHMFVFNVMSDGTPNLKYGEGGMFEILDNGMQNTMADIALSHGNYGDIIVGAFTAHADNFGTDIALGKFHSAAIPTIPVIETNVQALSGFYYAEGDGPSEPQTYQLNAYNIEHDVTVSVTGEYEISADGVSYTSELAISPASIPAAIYVRLKTNLAEGSYEGEVTNTYEDADPAIVHLYGMVDEPEGVGEINGMNVYVWASNNNIVIENNTDNDVMVSVYNIAGQNVYNTTAGVGTQKLDRAFTAGAYIVKFIANNSESVSKVIVR